MSTQSRTIALVTYLLPLVGPLGALAGRRADPLVRYHALQALAIDLGALALPLLWAALGWLLAWVPTAGPVLALASFGLVLAFEVLLLAGRLLGMAWALRGQLRPAPLVGAWAERQALAAEPPPAPAAPEPAAEPLNVER
ncbi:MAG TPA: hypothetical protein VNL77_17030 [Roseiflexaceae bacterium]|nr:hypothetical protein [Roseiflexaceae bacterium]